MVIEKFFFFWKVLIFTGTNSKTLWVGLEFLHEEYPAELHGDLTWTVTIHRKDGSSSNKKTSSGKFNYGRFLISVDKLVKSWGSLFSSEVIDNIKDITVEIVFKRSNEKKITNWIVETRHSSEE